MQASLLQNTPVSVDYAVRDASSSRQLSKTATLQPNLYNVTDEEKAARIDKVAKDFEGVFLNYYLKQYFKDVGKSDPLFGESNAMSIWRDMLLDEYAKKITQNGGLGIADKVKMQIQRYEDAQKLHPANRNTVIELKEKPNG